MKIFLQVNHCKRKSVEIETSTTRLPHLITIVLVVDYKTAHQNLITLALRRRA
jgi:hypothetical protein